MHKKSAHFALMQTIEAKGFDIALISEIYVNPRTGKSPGIPNGYSLFCSGTGNQKTAILARKTLNAFQIGDESNDFATFCRIDFNQGSSITWASLYAPHSDKTLPIQALESLIHSQIHPNQRQIVIAADTNCRSTLLNYESSDPIAMQWEDLISRYSITVENDPSAATYKNSRNQSSRIDWTLSNLPRNATLENWKTEENLDITSDHIPITFKVSSDKFSNANPTKIKIWKATDWKAVNCSLNTEITKLLTSIDPTTEEEVEDLSNALEALCKETIENHVPSKVKKPFRSRWWNEKCEDAKRIYFKSKRRYRNDPSRISQAKHNYEQTILNSKQKSFEEFIQAKGDKGEIFLIHKMLTKPQSNITFKQILKEDQSLTQSQEDTLETLLGSVVKPLTAEQRKRDGKLNTKSPNTQTTSQEKKITVKDINLAINSINTNKAPGPDSIPPIFYKSCRKPLMPALSLLFNRMLQLGVFPKNLKVGEMIFIPKPNKKGDRTNHYRPITLLNTISKIFEKILNIRLKALSQENEWISKSQFGYQDQVSAEDAVVNLCNKLCSDFKYRRETLTVFFDVSGAFNDMWHSKLLSIITTKKSPDQITKLISSFLSGREVFVETPSGKLWKTLEKGTPQGAVISPLLWNTFYEDLQDNLKQKHPEIETTFFADDLAIHATCDGPDDRKRIETMMNNVIETVCRWGEDNFLKFNPDKTTAVLFSRYHKPIKKTRHTISLRMNDQVLTLAKDATYLGVILDSSLTFHKHITQRINKAKRILLALNSVISKEWGLSGEAIRTIYTMAIIPTVFWAVSCWSRCLDLEMYRKKLRSLQRLAAIKITKCYRQTSTEALLVLAGTPPLHLVGRRLATNTASRQLRNEPVDTRLNLRQQHENHTRITKHKSSTQTNFELITEYEQNNNRRITQNQEHRSQHDTPATDVARPYRNPTLQFKRYTKNNLMVNWQRSWDSATTGRFCHSLIKRVENNSTIKSKLQNQMLSGHYYTNSYALRIKKSESGKCYTCNVDDTIEHLLIYCKRHFRLRIKHNVNHLYNLLLVIGNETYLKELDAARSATTPDTNLV